MNKKKINIGLDIGIASVGWSIIDEDFKIVDMGVRLFSDVSDAKTGKLKNVNRREKRSLRRQIRRKRNRKNILLKFFVENNLINSEEEYYEKINKSLNNFDVSTISELKEKMLNEKLNNNALILVLFNYIHNRGYFYLEDEDDNNKEKNKLNTNTSINVEVNDDFPSIQLNNFYKKHGFYKGSDLSRKFSADLWRKEIEHLLKIQGKDEKFFNDYINIFNLIRDYSQGPGSQRSPTPYGLWRPGEKEPIGDNLWDVTIGKCTIYNDLNRGMKNSPIAEIFNLLNDLNNVHYLNKNKLTKEDKVKYFKELSLDLDKDKIQGINRKKISKIIDIDDSLLEGWNDDKKVSIKNYVNISKWLIKNNFWKGDKYLLNLDLLEDANNIFNELSKIKDINKRTSKLKELYPESKEDLNNELIKKLSGMSQTHSFSYKAMKEYIIFGIDNSKNQMELFADKIKENRNKKFKDQKYIPKGLFNEEIISPTARRSFNQSISIINKIIKKYNNEYDIDHITIELAREKNTVDQRKNISNMQKRNRENIEEVIKREKIEINLISNIKKQKLKLWEEQDHKDLYDGKEIMIEDILNNNNLDIDHIIPYSISMDNSLSNKVLTKNFNNKEKGNLTPYQYLSSKGEYEEFKNRVNNIYGNQDKVKKYKNKINKLLFEDDPIVDMNDFILRNLVDTRYASRLVLDTLKTFFKNKAIINVINGSVTHYCRNKIFCMSKDRDDYKHHAVDASIACFLGMNPDLRKLANFENMIQGNNKKYKRKNEKIIDSETGEFEIIDNETGEVINLKNNFELNEKNKKFKEELYRTQKECKFSRMMITKENMQLSNETINSFRIYDNKNYIIKKIDIMNSPLKDLEKYFNKDSNDKNDLLIYNGDRNLYDKLFTIFNNYSNEKNENPFVSFMKEHYPEDSLNRIKIDNQYIRNLKIKGKSKNLDNVILLKGHNNKSFLDTLSIKELRIYKNDKEKYCLVGINYKVLKSINNKLVIDQDKLNKELEQKNILNKNYILIKNGTIFIDEKNNIFYSNGGGDLKQNKIEIKPLWTTWESYFKKNNIKKLSNRSQIAISSIMKDYFIAELDVLGNIYNKRKIEIL